MILSSLLLIVRFLLSPGFIFKISINMKLQFSCLCMLNATNTMHCCYFKPWIYWGSVSGDAKCFVSKPFWSVAYLPKSTSFWWSFGLLVWVVFFLMFPGWILWSTTDVLPPFLQVVCSSETQIRSTRPSAWPSSCTIRAPTRRKPRSTWCLTWTTSKRPTALPSPTPVSSICPADYVLKVSEKLS